MFNRIGKIVDSYPVTVKTKVPNCDVVEVENPFLGEIFMRQMPFNGQETAEWDSTKWWRVIAPDGTLWCETSFEDEARAKCPEGYMLQRLYQKTEEKWVTEE